VAAGVAAVIGVAVLLNGLKPPANPPQATPMAGPADKAPPAPPAPGEDLRAELARLKAEADLRQDLVRRLLAAEDAHKQQAKLRQLQGRPSAAEGIDRAIARAASIMVYQADNLLDPKKDRQTIIATYRQVVELFGKTQSANVARQRLREIEKS
jgi:hypothetical protein